jgi:hypothetical protein
MRVPVRRSAAVLVLSFVLAACGSSPTPTPGGSGNPATSPASTAGSGPSGLAGTLQKGPVDPNTLAAWRPQVAFDPQAVGAKAAELGADLRKQVDAAATYGPIVTDQEKALEQAEGQVMAKLRDQLQAKLGGGATVPDATLASHRTPAGDPRVRPSQGLLSVTWVLVLILSTIAISSFDPKTGDMPEVTFTQPFNETTDHGSTQADATLAYSVTGGVVSAKLTLTGSVSGNDASGSQVTTGGQSSYDFTINPCPDPGGGVAGAVDVTDSETTFSPGRMTLGWSITGHTDYTATVNDQAELASLTAKATWDEKLTRTIDQSHESDIALSDTLNIGPDGTADKSDNSFSIDNMDGTITTDQAKATVAMMSLLGELTPYMLVLMASDIWKGGKCFEVRPDPKEATVDPGSQTPIKVTVYHWVDKADVQLPVRATLSGPKQIDPSGQPVTSPANFTYTAGGPGTTGSVEYKVVSKRGIGSTTGTYKVKGNLTVDLTGTLKMNGGGVWVYNLAVKGAGIQLTAADDGTISATGQVTVKGTAKALLAPCSATINEKIGVQARGQLQGPPDAQVWHVQIGPLSENNLGQVVKCPYISVPTNQGDYFGQWSTTLGYVDIPAAGGTLNRSGSNSGLLSRQATGTFVATTR